MPPRPTLSAFLATARAALRFPTTSNPLTLVVGNESADIDSLCSAILLAYIRTHQPPTTTTTTRLHIPLANIPRADFALRPEFAGVLRHVGLVPDDVPSLSDIFDFPPSSSDNDAILRGVLTHQKPNLLLVDHNALTGPLRRHFAVNVVGCIDHHVEEHAVPTDCAPEPRIVDTVGSCATLVVEYARAAWGQAITTSSSSSQTPCEADAQLARLALAPILVDTAGFTNPYKTTPRDIAAAEFLEGVLARVGAAGADAARGYVPEDYLAELRRLESDLGRMSVRDMLRKDYKQWEDHGCVLGVSAVVQPFEYIISRAAESSAPSSSSSSNSAHDAFLAAVRGWGEERGLDVVVVMTVSRSEGKLRRELLVWALTERGERAAREFEQRSAGFLQLSAWGAGELEPKDGDGELKCWRRGWHQGNLSQSRKQVAPLLREAVGAALG